ncbi:MAG TPA: hypothetical protein VN541_19640 [Tepidisphaeraceae bacterium]|nr:hypothetical protein [Tepidisphaeraceae bacterium]
MRLVVDTNLMIRALLSAGPARQFFKLAPLEHQIILTEDEDLLVLDPWRGIRVMRLFQFLKDHPLSTP